MSNNHYNFSFKHLYSTYQNHVLNNNTYKSFWSYAMTKTMYIKNVNGMYQHNAFQKIGNTFFNYVASDGCPVAAGNCILHYMHSGNKKPKSRSPQTFLTCFQKALHAVKLLDYCYKKEHENNKAKIPQDPICEYRLHDQHDFDTNTMEDLKNFFKGHYDTNTPKKSNHYDNKSCASHCIKASFTNHDGSSNNVSSSHPPSHCSNERLCNQSCSG